MTFKHVKFQDSPTMRALEKFAKDKGLIKPEPLQKSAALAKRADLTPSDNLMDNIFKLCAGMRAQGLEKEAAEVETNYLNYKRAQTLYEAHKEKGEDVIQFAHPKGSHKLEGVEGDEAVVEDILDKHVKFLQMIEKKPTGKLSNASQVLNAVKRALGEDQSEAGRLESQIRNNVNQVISILDRVAERAKPEMTAPTDWDWNVNPIKEAANNPTRDNLKSMKSNLNALIDRIKPGWVMGITENTWNKLAGPLLNKGIQLINQAAEWRDRANEIYAKQELGDYSEKGPDDGSSGALAIPEVTVKGDPLSGRLQNLIGRLQAAVAVRSISNNPAARKWIADEIAEIKKEQARIGAVPEEQRESVNAQLQGDVAAYEKEVNDFYTDWVNATSKA